MRRLSDVIIVLVFFAIQSYPSASTQCKKGSRLLNRKLDGHVIESQKVDNSDECMKLCLNHRKCYSVNYHLKERKCELNERTRLSNPDDVIRADHVIHEDNPARDYRECSYLLCRKMEVCLASGGRATCKGRDCWIRPLVTMKVEYLSSLK